MSNIIIRKIDMGIGNSPPQATIYNQGNGYSFRDYQLNEINEWNFQTVGPAQFQSGSFTENRVFEPWQGRHWEYYPSELPIDNRFKLGTYTTQNRSYWELNTYNESSFSSNLKGNKLLSDSAGAKLTNSSDYPSALGDEVNFVIPLQEPPSFSVDTFVYKVSDEKRYPLFFYYDEKLHKEEYDATTEGKVSLKIVNRRVGRGFEENNLSDNSVHFNPFLARPTLKNPPAEPNPQFTYIIYNHNFNVDTTVETGNVRIQWASIPLENFVYERMDFEGDVTIHDWNLSGNNIIRYKLYAKRVSSVPETYQHIGDVEGNNFFDFHYTNPNYQINTTFQFRLRVKVDNPNGGDLFSNWGGEVETFNGVTTSQYNFDFPVGSVGVAIDSNNTNLRDRLRFLYYDEGAGENGQWNLTEVNEDSFKLIVGDDFAYPQSQFQDKLFIAALNTGGWQFDHWVIEGGDADSIGLITIDPEQYNYTEDQFPSEFNYLDNIKMVTWTNESNQNNSDLTEVHIRADYEHLTAGNAAPVNVSVYPAVGGETSPYDEIDGAQQLSSGNQILDIEAFPDNGKQFVKWEVTSGQSYVGFGPHYVDESQVRDTNLKWNPNATGGSETNPNSANVRAVFANANEDPPGGGTCFLEGTPITMADGTTKPIEQIKVGDLVMSYDENTKTIVNNKVVETMFHKANPQHLSYGKYLIINNTMRVTLNHAILADTNGRSPYDWPLAEVLKVDDYLYDKDLNKVRIHAIELVEAIVDTYNFEVENSHTYIAENYIVHNIGGDGPGGGKGGGPRPISVGTYMETQDLGGTN